MVHSGFADDSSGTEGKKKKKKIKDSCMAGHSSKWDDQQSCLERPKASIAGEEEAYQQVRLTSNFLAHVMQILPVPTVWQAGVRECGRSNKTA